GLGGRKGYIDRTGTTVEGIRFDDAYPFQGGFGRVQVSDECWFVNRSGRLAFRPGGADAPLAGRAWRFSEGMALFMAGEGRACRYGFLDTTGRLVVDAVFLRADDFHEGLAPARDAGTGRLGYIDPSGNWAIEPQFDEASVFAYGRAFVRAGDKAGFIGRAGRFVIESGNRSYGITFNEGLVVFGRNEKFGYADTAGRVVIQPRFDDAGVFSDGMAWVKVGDRCGYIDRQGNIVIRPQFELTGVDNYYDGMVLVTCQGKQQYMDKTGRVVWREP
ncbi:WG repeat-containing protein, partial [candidate division WOR-3 bacterium]|nr:WG repeat-containing protein [candidate division WOR-3 bacterium]